MTNNISLHRSSMILAGGGLAWVAKIAVIAASDGAETGFASTLAAILYLLGVAGMAAGLCALAVSLSAGRPVAVRVLAGVAGFVSFFAAYVAIESVAKGIAGDSGPAWFGDEVGILATGALLAAAGLYAARAAAGSPRARAV